MRDVDEVALSARRGNYLPLGEFLAASTQELASLPLLPLEIENRPSRDQDMAIEPGFNAAKVKRQKALDIVDVPMTLRLVEMKDAKDVKDEKGKKDEKEAKEIKDVQAAYPITAKFHGLEDVAGCLGSKYTLEGKDQIGSGAYGAVWKVKSSDDRVMVTKFQTSTTSDVVQPGEFKTGERWTMPEFMKRVYNQTGWPDKVTLPTKEARSEPIVAFVHEAYWTTVASEHGYGPRLYDIFICPEPPDQIFGLMVLELFSMDLKTYISLLDKFSFSETRLRLENEIRQQMQAALQEMDKDMEHRDLHTGNALVYLNNQRTAAELTQELKYRGGKTTEVYELLRLRSNRGFVFADFGFAVKRKTEPEVPFDQLWVLFFGSLDQLIEIVQTALDEKLAPRLNFRFSVTGALHATDSVSGTRCTASVVFLDLPATARECGLQKNVSRLTQLASDTKNDHVLAIVAVLSEGSKGGWIPPVIECCHVPRYKTDSCIVVVMKLPGLTILELMDLLLEVPESQRMEHVAKLKSVVLHFLQVVFGTRFVRRKHAGAIGLESIAVKKTKADIESKMKQGTLPNLSVWDLVFVDWIKLQPVLDKQSIEPFALRQERTEEIWRAMNRAFERLRGRPLVTTASVGVVPSLTKQTTTIETKMQVGARWGVIHRSRLPPGLWQLQSLSDIGRLPVHQCLVVSDGTTNDAVFICARPQGRLLVYLRLPPSQVQEAQQQLLTICRQFGCSLDIRVTET